MILRCLLGSIVFATVVAACSPVAGPATRSDRLIIAQSREPSSLNPIFDAGFVNAELSGLAFAYLLGSVRDGEVTADTAATIPTRANGGISRDGLTITYR